MALVGLLALACGSAEPSPPAALADRIVVEKAQRRLELLAGGVSLRSYRIALGSNPVGPKIQEGDGRTPEGIYVIDGRNEQSGFHRALHISYPNERDRARAAELGVDPGGEIMIHGIRNGLGWFGRLHLLMDWTHGCIAVTNAEIEEIWALVPDGTVLEIRP